MSEKKKKLGYTFYPKDWRSSDAVFGLTLQEKGFYRELIDECFIEQSEKIHVNVRSFTRKHGINARTYSKLIQKLCETSLIVLENFDETMLYVPSVCSRMGVISRARNGGNAKAKSDAKRSAERSAKENITITEYEIEQQQKGENQKIDVDDFFNPDKWDEFANRLIDDRQQQESLVRNNRKLSIADEPFHQILDKFIIDQKARRSNFSNYKDGCSHFNNWIGKTTKFKTRRPF